MGDDNRGSGLTSKKVLRELREHCADQFRDTLTKMRVSSKMIAAQTAAFEDGMATMVTHLRAMGVIVVIDDSEKTK